MIKGRFLTTLTIQGATIGLSLGLSSQAQAALFLDPGDINLLPNLANQQVEFQVQNDGPQPIDVLGIQFHIQIDDGIGTILTPTITDVDLLTGTIFENDNTGQSGQMDTEQRWEVYTLENGGSPPPSLPTGFSTTATVTFDTTGFTMGTWDLFLTTPAGSTTFLNPDDAEPLAMTLFDGTISVVPEPSTVFAGIGCVVFGVVSLWRNKRGKSQK